MYYGKTRFGEGLSLMFTVRTQEEFSNSFRMQCNLLHYQLMCHESTHIKNALQKNVFLYEDVSISGSTTNGNNMNPPDGGNPSSFGRK